MLVIILIVLAVIWLFSWGGPRFYPAYATIFEISSVERQLTLVIDTTRYSCASLLPGSNKNLAVI